MFVLLYIIGGIMMIVILPLVLEPMASPGGLNPGSPVTEENQPKNRAREGGSRKLRDKVRRRVNTRSGRSLNDRQRRFLHHIWSSPQT